MARCSRPTARCSASSRPSAAKADPRPVIAGWPAADGEEYALAFDEGREARLLVLPALFDEANKLRRFSAEVMRRLDAAGIDTLLPDLPGCNESLAPLEGQTLAGWREVAG